jgi:hypothetical protein
MVNFLLEDLDFLETWLMEHSPLINIAERRTGIDVPTRFYLARHTLAPDWWDSRISQIWLQLEREPSMENTRRVAEIFSHHVVDHLFPSNFGHMRSHHPELVRNGIINRHLCDEGIADETRDCYPSIHDVIYRNPNVVLFYNPDLENINNLHQEFVDFGYTIPNVTTRIISPDSIAHIRFAHFISSPNVLEHEILQALEFYEEVNDFDHLIIDLRGNQGGLNLNLRELIFSPLINEPLEVAPQQFLRESFVHSVREHDLQYGADFERHGFKPATEFINERNLYNIHPDDLDFLNYVFTFPHAIEPVENNFPFDGKIWFLVDNQTASISELAVLYAMSTGFATVVGDNTMGLMPSATTVVALPNTGIVFRFDIGYYIDETGRSMEEFGITPHYPNRLGLDALNTVLQMIEELDAH